MELRRTSYRHPAFRGLAWETSRSAAGSAWTEVGELEADTDRAPEERSRREFLKRSAAAGAVLWAAPAIASVPAYAQGSPAPCDAADVCDTSTTPDEGPCGSTCVQWNVDGTCICARSRTSTLDEEECSELFDGLWLGDLCGADGVNCITPC